jgi:hypothetical protein
MKKIFFVFLISLIFSDRVLAEPIGFGIKGGVNMANQVPDFNYNDGTTSITSDVLFGFAGGVFVDVGLANFLSMQPEANFSMKGYEENLKNTFSNEGFFANSSMTFSYNYFEIPLLLKVHTSLIPHLEGSLLAGPSAGFLLNANNHFSATSFSENYSLKGYSLDWGLVFGTEFEMDKFLIDFRYDLGLTSVSPNYPGGPTNSVLSLEVGYRIQ